MISIAKMIENEVLVAESLKHWNTQSTSPMLGGLGKVAVLACLSMHLINVWLGWSMFTSVPQHSSLLEHSNCSKVPTLPDGMHSLGSFINSYFRLAYEDISLALSFKTLSMYSSFSFIRSCNSSVFYFKYSLYIPFFYSEASLSFYSF